MSRVAVVTGANKGIGLAIVKQLAAKSDVFKHVVLCSRSVENGTNAKASIVSALPSAQATVQVAQLDITSDDSVKAFATQMSKEYGKIDVLVNNAGFAFKGSAFGSDVARQTIDVNYHGTKRVTEALLPLLSDNARVVFVCSRAGILQRYSPSLQQRFLDPNITPSDIDVLTSEFIAAADSDDFKALGWPGTTYGVSKAAESAYSRYIARILHEQGRVGILSTAMCPGYVATDMSSHKGPKTPDQGADTAVWLATLGSGHEVKHGKFFGERKELDWISASF